MACLAFCFHFDFPPSILRSSWKLDLQPTALEIEPSPTYLPSIWQEVCRSWEASENKNGSPRSLMTLSCCFPTVCTTWILSFLVWQCHFFFFFFDVLPLISVWLSAIILIESYRHNILWYVPIEASTPPPTPTSPQKHLSKSLRSSLFLYRRQIDLLHPSCHFGGNKLFFFSLSPLP